jgi:hypothetical protein
LSATSSNVFRRARRTVEAGAQPDARREAEAAPVEAAPVQAGTNGSGRLPYGLKERAPEPYADDDDAPPPLEF